MYVGARDEEHMIPPMTPALSPRSYQWRDRKPPDVQRVQRIPELSSSPERARVCVPGGSVRTAFSFTPCARLAIWVRSNGNTEVKVTRKSPIGASRRSAGDGFGHGGHGVRPTSKGRRNARYRENAWSPVTAVTTLDDTSARPVGRVSGSIPRRGLCGTGRCGTRTS